MLRASLALVACLAIVAVLFVQPTMAQPPKQQMVKGTIKTVDTSKDLLVINQKVKNETVDRELSILDTTEFVVMTASGKREAVGNAGLRLLEGQEGANVQVRCDKDVNVLKVTVTSKK